MPASDDIRPGDLVVLDLDFYQKNPHRLPGLVLQVEDRRPSWFLVHWSKPLESAAGASWEQWHHVSKLSVISRP
jgi:hypothetical protein